MKGEETFKREQEESQDEYKIEKTEVRIAKLTEEKEEFEALMRSRHSCPRNAAAQEGKEGKVLPARRPRSARGGRPRHWKMAAAWSTLAGASRRWMP